MRDGNFGFSGGLLAGSCEPETQESKRMCGSKDKVLPIIVSRGEGVGVGWGGGRRAGEYCGGPGEQSYMRARSFLPTGDVPLSKELRLNSSAICCLRTCCGDVATSTVKMECLRPAGAKVGGADC